MNRPPARKSLLAKMRLIAVAAPCRPPARASVPPDGLCGRRGLFLPRLHQAGLEQDRIELGIVVPPALIGRLGVARLDDEAGLFCLGLEVGILQRRDDIGLQKPQAVFRACLSDR